MKKIFFLLFILIGANVFAQEVSTRKIQPVKPVPTDTSRVIKPENNSGKNGINVSGKKKTVVTETPVNNAKKEEEIIPSAATSSKKK